MSATVIKSTTIDDRDGNVTYVPDRWTVHTNVESIFHLYSNSDTFSDIQGATATVKFYGNAIEYWGNQGPYHGPCIVSVDGYEMATVNSHADADGYPILLYAKNGLALGDHELQVKVVDPAYPNVCEVDRFVVNITSGTSSGGNGAPSNGSGGSSKGSKKGLPIGAIAGAAGGAAAILILLIGFFLCMQSKKKAARRGRTIGISKPLLHDIPSSPSPQTPSFLQNPNHPLSYISSSSPLVSYNPPSTYISGSPPLGAAGAFGPHASLAYNQGTNTTSPTSMGSVPLSAGRHASVGLTSAMSFTSGAATMSDYIPGLEADGTAEYVPNQYQPVSHALAPEQSAQRQYTMPADSTSLASPSPGETVWYASGSEKAGFSASSVTSGSGSQSAAGGAGRPRRDVLSSSAAPELPPPAYED